MEATIKAILARFKGDRTAARRYCVDLSISQAFKNKGLSSEYWELAMYFSERSAHVTA